MKIFFQEAVANLSVRQQSDSTTSIPNIANKTISNGRMRRMQRLIGRAIYISIFASACRTKTIIRLKGKKIGIVGVGHVGSIVAHHCRTIGMTVLLNDPPRANTEQNDTFVSLDTIAEECDFITFHTPLNRTGIY